MVSLSRVSSRFPRTDRAFYNWILYTKLDYLSFYRNIELFHTGFLRSVPRVFFLVFKFFYYHYFCHYLNRWPINDALTSISCCMSVCFIVARE